MQSSTEEDYLKAIYKHTKNASEGVSTNTLADELNTKASSVTDMLKKLSDKKLVHYVKYQGTKLSKEGRTVALRVIRKHRLWEVFLVDKLKFGWDEIHEIAEQLEHIRSAKLIDKLDDYLGNPKADPHGDPIPDKNGKFHEFGEVKLSAMKKNQKGVLIGVLEHSKEFLQYLDALKINLGSEIEVIERYAFDQSILIEINSQQQHTISELVSTKLNIIPNEK